MPFKISALNLPVIKRGSVSEAVSAWQRFLQDMNFPIGGVDGGFGGVTEKVTKVYQEKNKLAADGIVGPGTYAKALSQGFIYRVAGLTGARLLDYLNFGPAEVKNLQQSLNAIAKLTPPLTADGDFGLWSTKALAEVHKQLDAGFRAKLDQQLAPATKQKLGTDAAAALDIITEYGRRQRLRLSGAQWVRFFPASRSLDDLASPFRQRAQAFEKAMKAAGAEVVIANTYRPPERAYMMHYCVRLNNRELRPVDVPPLAGIDIDWVHYNDAISYQAARDMVQAFDIGSNPAALRSRHTQALAVDWAITWKDTLKIKDANGREVSLTTPRNGDENERMWDVGATYGVYKLEFDPPHWSVDGY
jgi:peptidoglycan hydrolase-like protein with peptidoglycan-binding domain